MDVNAQLKSKAKTDNSWRDSRKTQKFNRRVKAAKALGERREELKDGIALLKKGWMSDEASSSGEVDQERWQKMADTAKSGRGTVRVVETRRQAWRALEVRIFYI